MESIDEKPNQDEIKWTRKLNSELLSAANHQITDLMKKRWCSRRDIPPLCLAEMAPSYDEELERIPKSDAPHVSEGEEGAPNLSSLF